MDLHMLFTCWGGAMGGDGVELSVLIRRIRAIVILCVILTSGKISTISDGPPI